MPTMTTTLFGMPHAPLHSMRLREELIERLVVGARVIEIRQMSGTRDERELRVWQHVRQLSAGIDAGRGVVLAVDDQDGQIELGHVATACGLPALLAHEILARIATDHL